MTRARLIWGAVVVLSLEVTIFGLVNHDRIYMQWVENADEVVAEDFAREARSLLSAKEIKGSQLATIFRHARRLKLLDVEILALERQVSDHPDDPTLTFALADTVRRSGDFIRARRLYLDWIDERSQAEAPNSAPMQLAWIGLARVERDAGELPRARAYFELAGDLASADRHAPVEYFWTLTTLDLDEALDHGYDALRTDPDNEPVREWLIGQALARGNANEAQRLVVSAVGADLYDPRWTRWLDLADALRNSTSPASTNPARRPMFVSHVPPRPRVPARLASARPWTCCALVPSLLASNPAGVVDAGTVASVARPIEVNRVWPLAETLALGRTKAAIEQQSWGGRLPAIALYDAYLAAVPGDVDAMRKQARVAGWAGRIEDARRRYAAITAVVPNDRAAAAEARAKSAYYGLQWADALRAYDAWLAVEPQNTEARFEHAEVLWALGRTAESQRELQALAANGHEQAQLAIDRRHETRQPTPIVRVETRASNGYDGGTLLEQRSQTGSLAGGDAHAWWRVDVSGLTASGAGQRSTGVGAAASSSRRFTDEWSGSVAVGADQFVGWSPVVTGSATVSAQAAHRISLDATLQRQRVQENAETFKQGLMASGLSVTVARHTERTSLSAAGAIEHLSDGNQRRQVTASVSRALTQGRSQLRGVGWAQVQSYEHPADTYFAPDHFVRVDAGAEYAMSITPPRFSGDRQRELVASMLVGTDNRGEIYTHPSARLVTEIKGGIEVDAFVDLIDSRVYRERRAGIAVKFTPGSRR